MHSEQHTTDDLKRVMPTPKSITDIVEENYTFEAGKFVELCKRLPKILWRVMNNLVVVISNMWIHVLLLCLLMDVKKEGFSVMM